MKISIPKENVDYEAEILEYIKDKSEGVTITDIADETDFSRNTVSKYVSILGLKKKYSVGKLVRTSYILTLKKFPLQKYSLSRIIRAYYQD